MNTPNRPHAATASAGPAARQSPSHTNQTAATVAGTNNPADTPSPQQVTALRTGSQPRTPTNVEPGSTRSSRPRSTGRHALRVFNFAADRRMTSPAPDAELPDTH